MHYKNITDKQVVALYIALERTGYFEYRIDVYRGITGLILMNKERQIKIYVQIEMKQMEAKSEVMYIKI